MQCVKLKKGDPLKDWRACRYTVTRSGVNRFNGNKITKFVSWKSWLKWFCLFIQSLHCLSYIVVTYYFWYVCLLSYTHPPLHFQVKETVRRPRWSRRIELDQGANKVIYLSHYTVMISHVGRGDLLLNFEFELSCFKSFSGTSFA